PVHVAHLVLHRVEEVQPEESERTGKAEVVREIRDRQTLVSLESRVAPPLSEVAPLAADHLDGGEVGLPQVEPRRQYQGVDDGLAAGGVDDAGGLRSEGRGWGG